MNALDDLLAGHRRFDELVSGLSAVEWTRPSAAAGWTIGDQVAHLADTEEVALDTLTGGPRRFSAAMRPFATAAEFTEAGCRRGRAMWQGDVIDWWRAGARATASALAGLAPDARVGWGFGMSAETFAAARLMEHWAHRLDITDALGLPSLDGEWRVADLGLATLRYAFARAKVRPPTGRRLRLVLTTKDGETRELGDTEATDTVHGSLTDWCRTAVRRVRSGSALRADGPLAQLALRHARAYL